MLSKLQCAYYACSIKYHHRHFLQTLAGERPLKLCRNVSGRRLCWQMSLNYDGYESTSTDYIEVVNSLSDLSFSITITDVVLLCDCKTVVQQIWKLLPNWKSFEASTQSQSYKTHNVVTELKPFVLQLHSWNWRRPFSLTANATFEHVGFPSLN